MKKLGLIFLLFFCEIALLADSNIHLQVLYGEQIRPYAAAITNLCCIVFREYPWLYESSDSEVSTYIQYYASSSKGVVCLLFDGEQLIGAVTGMPVSEMREDYKQPLLNQPDLNLSSLFYLGELILLKEYRRKGYGKRMYYALEQEACRMQYFEKICFCTILDPEQHPLMPTDYCSLNGFWQSLGFIPQPHLYVNDIYKEISMQDPISHVVYYWMKDLVI